MYVKLQYNSFYPYFSACNCVTITLSALLQNPPRLQEGPRKQLSLNFWKTTENANFLLLVHMPDVVYFMLTANFIDVATIASCYYEFFLVRQLRPERRYTVKNK